MAEGGLTAGLPPPQAAGGASRGETVPEAEQQQPPGSAVASGEQGSSSHVVQLYLAHLVLYELVDLAQYPPEV